MFKRVALFIATNLAVLLVLSIVLRLLGVDSVLDERGVGIDFQALLVLSLVIGFGGSFISLAISKWMAKRSTGARVITHPYRKGNGAAVKTGIRAASGTNVVLLDGDGQHPPEAVPQLVEALGTYDMVVAARSGMGGAGAHRWMANRVYNALAGYVAGHRVEDLTSGFRAARRAVLRGIRRAVAVGGIGPVQGHVDGLEADAAEGPYRADQQGGRSTSARRASHGAGV